MGFFLVLRRSSPAEFININIMARFAFASSLYLPLQSLLTTVPAHFAPVKKRTDPK